MSFPLKSCVPASGPPRPAGVGSGRAHYKLRDWLSRTNQASITPTSPRSPGQAPSLIPRTRQRPLTGLPGPDPSCPTSLPTTQIRCLLPCLKPSRMGPQCLRNGRGLRPHRPPTQLLLLTTPHSGHPAWLRAPPAPQAPARPCPLARSALLWPLPAALFSLAPLRPLPPALCAPTGPPLSFITHTAAGRPD